MSEPFAFRHAPSLGSSFDIFTDRGSSTTPDVAVEALLLSILAALLAGLYPAWKMSRASPAATLRDE